MYQVRWYQVRNNRSGGRSLVIFEGNTILFIFTRTLEFFFNTVYPARGFIFACVFWSFIGTQEHIPNNL